VKSPERRVPWPYVAVLTVVMYSVAAVAFYVFSTLWLAQ
jgi:nitrate reductase NapE component